jgi:hypothetical protein
MKILFLIVVFLFGSVLLAQGTLGVFDTAACERDRALIDTSQNIDIPKCDTKDHYDHIEWIIAHPQVAQPQPKRQDPPVAPQGPVRDPNKFYCDADPGLGSPVASSWDDCLAKANKLYCDSARGPTLLVTYSKGDKVQQKQLKKEEISCAEGAAKNDGPAKKYPCIYKGGSYPGIDLGHEFGSFSSNADCLKAIKENFHLKPTSMCYDSGSRIDTYILRVKFQLSTTSISDETLKFDCNANNWGAKPSHSSLDGTTQVTQPSNQPVTAP